MKFAEALDRKVEDIKQPPNMPIGTYSFTITKHPESSEIAQGRFEKLTFLLACIDATDDVDPDDLKDYGSPNGTILRKDFLFPTEEDKENDFDRTLVNLKRFLSHCGVEEEGSLKEMIAQSVGSQVLAEVRHRPNPNDESQVFQELGRTAPVE